ncbi:MAG: response regulator transcription factor [Bacteroidetes bacterium]|nr:response regulator transcription factor [Bacteroidota bacterium]MBU1117151.1 response regulator transcription factor [Bacteroidota bacterium]MBU1798577.1 response regulator transcription factor [Bacteroidota bacterium]
MKEIKLLLIEDNVILRNNIIKILKPHKDLLVISTLGSGKYNLEKIVPIMPDVVLINFELQSKNKNQFIQTIRNDFPSSKIIVKNLPPVCDEILQFVKAGVNGFILQDASLMDLLITIRKVAKGSTVLPTLLTNSLFLQIVEYAVRDDKSSLREDVKMTKRECEVISLLGDGLSNNKIGKQLDISTYTVKSHIHNIMDKLSLHTRLEIANYSYIHTTN